jgi:N4-gp56 family major capsid protein
VPDVYFDTSTTNFDKTVQELIRQQLLAELRANLTLMQDVVPANYDAGKNVIRFPRYADLSVSVGTPTPGTRPWLTEGVTPDVEDLDIGYDDMTPYQAGILVGLTDVALAQSPHDLIRIASEKISRHAAETVNLYLGNTIAAGTPITTIYSGTSNNALSGVATGDLLDGDDIKQAVKALKVAKVPTFGDGYYHCHIRPEAVYGLMADTAAGGWIDANKYTDNRPLLMGELGRYAGVRFIESAALPLIEDQGTGSIDLCGTYIYGPEAWAFGDLQSIQTYFTAPGGGSDPLHQRAQVGWKGMFGAKVLTAAGARYVRIASATS